MFVYLLTVPAAIDYNNYTYSYSIEWKRFLGYNTSYLISQQDILLSMFIEAFMQTNSNYKFEWDIELTGIDYNNIRNISQYIYIQDDNVTSDDHSWLLIKVKKTK